MSKLKEIQANSIKLLEDIKTLPNFNNDHAVLMLGRQFIMIFQDRDYINTIDRLINTKTQDVPVNANTTTPPGVIEPRALRAQKKTIGQTVTVKKEQTPVENENEENEDVQLVDDAKVDEVKDADPNDEQLKDEEGKEPSTDIVSGLLADVKTKTVADIKKAYKLEELIVFAQENKIDLGATIPTYEKVIRLLKLL